MLARSFSQQRRGELAHALIALPVEAIRAERQAGLRDGAQFARDPQPLRLVRRHACPSAER
jgi:hypothetical protein